MPASTSTVATQTVRAADDPECGNGEGAGVDCVAAGAAVGAAGAMTVTLATTVCGPPFEPRPVYWIVCDPGEADAGICKVTDIPPAESDACAGSATGALRNTPASDVFGANPLPLTVTLCPGITVAWSTTAGDVVVAGVGEGDAVGLADTDGVAVAEGD